MEVQSHKCLNGFVSPNMCSWNRRKCAKYDFVPLEIFNFKGHIYLHGVGVPIHNHSARGYRRNWPMRLCRAKTLAKFIQNDKDTNAVWRRINRIYCESLFDQKKECFYSSFAYLTHFAIFCMLCPCLTEGAIWYFYALGSVCEVRFEPLISSPSHTYAI